MSRKETQVSGEVFVNAGASLQVMAGGNAMEGSKLFQWQRVSGQVVRVNDLAVTPQSQIFIVRWPTGVFIWNRPTAILVERNGQTEQRPIVDVTRTLLLGCVGLLSMTMVIARMMRRKEKNDHDRYNGRNAFIGREA